MSPRKQLQSSELVAALEIAWEAIRDAHPDIPRALIVVASGSMKRGTKAGHFAADRWNDGRAKKAPKAKRAPMVHEVLVSGEGMRGGAAEVMDTLLHEGAHALAMARGIQDVSRSGRYHNKKFKMLAEELGLIVDSHPAHGWALTRLAPATRKRWAKGIKALDKALSKSFRIGEPEGQAKPGSRMLKAQCDCIEAVRTIRVARKTFVLAAITCGVCEADFQLCEGEG